MTYIYFHISAVIKSISSWQRSTNHNIATEDDLVSINWDWPFSEFGRIGLAVFSSGMSKAH